MIERRGFLKGLIGVLAAPAIVRASSLMPISTFAPRWSFSREDMPIVLEEFAERYLRPAAEELRVQMIAGYNIYSDRIECVSFAQ